MTNSLPVVPERAELLRSLSVANGLAWFWVPLQITLMAVLAAFMDWQRIIAHPFIPTIAIGVMVGPLGMGIMARWALAKKEIGDLREETRFGQFDKYQLQTLFRDTLQRLDLPDERLPVYITADKSLNAGALHLGMGGFFKSLNGVYLNRQVLHKLEPEEVQDIMGHELGHYYRYYLLGERFRFVTVALGAMLGVYVSELVGMENFISFIVLSLTAGVFWKLSAVPVARHGQTIEYLCDDLGAHVHGVHVSISGLLRLGVDAELQTVVMQHALQSQHYDSLSTDDIVQAVQAAVPYGHASLEELKLAVEKSLSSRAKQQQLSLSGFIKHAWNSDLEEDARDELEEELTSLAQLQSLPRLNWESILESPDQGLLSEPQIEQLVQLIERQPSHLLFRIAEEAGQTDGIHPPLKSRILYLWKNRDAINQSREKIQAGW